MHTEKNFIAILIMLTLMGLLSPSCSQETSSLKLKNSPQINNSTIIRTTVIPRDENDYDNISEYTDDPYEAQEPVIDGVKLTTFQTRSHAVYIKINKISTQLFSIVKSLDLFKFLLPVEQDTEQMSLLNFDYREEQSEIADAYTRSRHFGKWVRDPKTKDCYNTRAKVLIRDNIGVIKFNENNPCSVDAGEWLDPYSGEKFTDAKMEIQIDHMVPLKEAYMSGAYKWSFQERCLYGNYMGYKNHLISSYGEENNKKGDKTPVDYMPNNPSYQCEYLKDWLKIKSIWGLSMSPSEATEVKRLIEKNNCDTSNFTITRQELENQYSFFTNNLGLCGERNQFPPQAEQNTTNE